MPRTYKARYTGAIKVNLPGGLALCTEAVEKARRSGQSTPVLLVVDSEIRLLDRRGSDVLLVAQPALVSCFGLVPPNKNFLCFVVQQRDFMPFHCADPPPNRSTHCSTAASTLCTILLMGSYFLRTLWGFSPPPNQPIHPLPQPHPQRSVPLVFAKLFYLHVLNLPASTGLEADAALCDLVQPIQGARSAACEILPRFAPRKPSVSVAPANSPLHARPSMSANHAPPARRASVINASPIPSPEPPGEFSPQRKPSLRVINVSKQSVRSFEGLYMGMLPVDTLFGTAVVKAAVETNNLERQQRNAINPSDGLGDPVTLTVTMEAVRTVDNIYGNPVTVVFIKNISYTCVLDSNQQADIFAYIAVNKRLGAVHCHMYHLPPGKGTLAYQAINEAFKLLAAEEQSRGADPFAVTDEKRDPAPDVLIKSQIHRADLKAIQQIGAGQFGSVFVAWQTVKDNYGNQEKVMRAVKLLRKAATDEDRKSFTKEAETMLSLNHPNLVKLVGVAVQQRPWLCVLEYMKYGDLKSLLETCREKQFPLRYREMLTYSAQLAAGCEFLAAKRMVHMDLAARNVLVGEHNTVKVADFGLTRHFDTGKNFLILRETTRLALKWVAPEGFSHKVFSEASDVWSYGVVLWEIASYGAVPYISIPSSMIQDAINNGLRLPKLSTCPTPFYEIMKLCWQQQPTERPTFALLNSSLSAMRDQSTAPERDVGELLARSKAGKGGQTIVANNSNSAYSQLMLQRAAAASEVVGGRGGMGHVPKSGGSAMTAMGSDGTLPPAPPRPSPGRKGSKEPAPAPAPPPAGRPTIMEQLVANYAGREDYGAPIFEAVERQLEQEQPKQQAKAVDTDEDFVLPQPVYENTQLIREAQAAQPPLPPKAETADAPSGNGVVASSPPAKPSEAAPKRAPSVKTAPLPTVNSPSAPSSGFVMPVLRRVEGSPARNGTIIKDRERDVKDFREDVENQAPAANKATAAPADDPQPPGFGDRNMSLRASFVAPDFQALTSGAVPSSENFGFGDLMEADSKNSTMTGRAKDKEQTAVGSNGAAGEGNDLPLGFSDDENEN